MSLTWTGPSPEERRKKDALALTRPCSDPTDQEKRREYVGGSDMAAVMGLDPWRTPLDVFEEKIGLAQRREDNLDLERGRRLEPWAIDEYEQEKGAKVITQPGEYRDGCLAGHPDGLVIHNTLPAGGLEVKCPRVHGWLKAKREGATPYMIIQGQTYLHLTAWPWIDFAVFNSEHGLLAFRMKFDPELTKRIKEAAETFWNEHVLPQVPPSEFALDPPELPEVGGELRVVDSRPWTERLERLRRAKDLRDEAELVWTGAKQDVAKEMRDLGVDVIEGAGVRVYNKGQRGRVTLDKKALTNARPLDRGKLISALEEPLGSHDASVVAAIIKDGECDFDIGDYERRSKPFRSFRHYLVRGG